MSVEHDSLFKSNEPSMFFLKCNIKFVSVVLDLYLESFNWTSYRMELLHLGPNFIFEMGRPLVIGTRLLDLVCLVLLGTSRQCVWNWEILVGMVLFVFF